MNKLVLSFLLAVSIINCFADECEDLEPVLCKHGYIFYLASCTAPASAWQSSVQPTYKPMVDKNGNFVKCKDK